MSAVPAGFVPPPLDNTLGALLIGVIISTGLYGMACLQTIRYYTSYPGDSVGIKTLVGGLWVLDTLHTIFISHATYHYVITSFGNYLALTQAVWSIVPPSGLNCITGAIVQFFLAYRVYLVSERVVYIPSLICLLACVQAGFGLAVMGIGFTIDFAGLVKYEPYITTSLASSAAADILIAVALSWYLLSRRRSGGVESTNGVINKLVLYTINSGALTSLLALVGLIAFVTMPNNLVNFGVNFVLGKTYSNCLLSTLNARAQLRERIGGGPIRMVDMSAELSTHSQTRVANSSNCIIVSTEVSRVGDEKFIKGHSYDEGSVKDSEVHKSYA